MIGFVVHLVVPVGFWVFVFLGGLGCMVLILVLDLRADYVGCYVFGVWFGFPDG